MLGVPEGATETEIESAYKALCQRLQPESFKDDSARLQARKCRRAIETAYRTLTNQEELTEYLHKTLSLGERRYETTHPRLGQICVASGIISMEQLDEAVQEQVKSGLPLGEVLEDKQFLSRAELEGLLMGQDLIDIDGEGNDPIGQRLIALGLATEDMVLIAQMELKWQAVSLNQVFVKRGWLDHDVSRALFGDS
jgi:curved DNA-binding protein CbpA